MARPQRRSYRRPVRFTLIDAILERSPTRLVAVKQVSLAEEYLWDHFPGFPVLPGVLMLEAMTQAAAALSGRPLVLHTVRALKYGSFVAPGETLRIEVERPSPDSLDFTARGFSVRAHAGEAPKLAVAGKLSLREHTPHRPAAPAAIQS